MSANQRFTFDTNILFYASDTDAGPKHERALLLTERAIRHDCILTLQSLAELANALLKKRAATAENVKQICESYRRSFPVVVSSEADLDEAMRAHTSYNTPLWDAMLWATARRAGCTLLLTEDFQDGRNLEGVIIRNPFALSPASFASLLQ